jgi:hypothetical protein
MTKRKTRGSPAKRPVRRHVISVPTGSATQQNSSNKLFDEYLDASNLSWSQVEEISISTKKATDNGSLLPQLNTYVLLDGFVRFLYNYEATKSRNKENKYPFSTADNYFSQAKQVLIENYGPLDESRCKQIRYRMKSLFKERDTILSISAHQAPPATEKDLIILSKMLHKKGTVESLQFYSMLVLQWHMLGRSIDCCFMHKRQVTVISSENMFISFSRLKTASLQGISIYHSKFHWETCPILALAITFITASMPSPFVFNHLNVKELRPEVQACYGVISQLEGTILGAIDDTACVPMDDIQDKKQVKADKHQGRQRPSAAQFTNLKLNQLYDDYLKEERIDNIGEEPLTKNLQSHSLRRGAAQHVNSSSKIAIQWLCTRGNWMMDSLSKAFAYIGIVFK